MNARQPTGDFPTMTTSAYSAQSYGGGQLMAENMLGLQNWQDVPQARQFKVAGGSPTFTVPPHQQAKEVPMATRRVVQVYIMDPNENVPLDKCVLYKGEEKLTDSNDQELFYEIDIKTLLDAYNVERVKFRDKTVKDREQFLEPARIRDLKMAVVEIAKF